MKLSKMWFPFCYPMKKLPGYPYGDRKDVTATETMAFLQKYYPEVYIGPPLSPSERRELLEELYGVY